MLALAARVVQPRYPTLSPSFRRVTPGPSARTTAAFIVLGITGLFPGRQWQRVCRDRVAAIRWRTGGLPSEPGPARKVPQPSRLRRPKRGTNEHRATAGRARPRAVSRVLRCDLGCHTPAARWCRRVVMSDAATLEGTCGACRERMSRLGATAGESAGYGRLLCFVCDRPRRKPLQVSTGPEIEVLPFLRGAEPAGRRPAPLHGAGTVPALAPSRQAMTPAEAAHRRRMLFHLTRTRRAAECR